MSPRLHKLVWSEGMYLAPHHFQAQSRFFEESIHFITGCFWQFSFGFLGLEVDENELRHGLFQLHHFRGILPDGLAFDLSKKEDTPASRDIADLFPSTGKPLTLLLALEPYRQGRKNVDPDKSSAGDLPQRFGRSVTPLADFNTGQDLKPVTLLRPNFRIVTEAEAATTELVTLPVARVLRDGKGQYVLDPAYVPPSLSVAASTRLTFILERLLEILAEKSRNLSQRRREAFSSGQRGDRKELMEFWLLHTINSAIPVLRLSKTGRSPHPAQLYRGLSQLAGALCTFGPGSDPMGLPLYDHLALGDCFGAIDRHIQQHLELGLPTNCVSIPLRRFQPLFFEGAIPDPRCFGPSRWVLTIKAEVPETTLIAGVPSFVKVSARDWIERVVRQAVQGAPLTYMPTPPSSVPVEFGAVCFSIDRDHPLFEPVRKFSNIGIYVHGELQNVELGLHVVIEGSR